MAILTHKKPGYVLSASKDWNPVVDMLNAQMGGAQFPPMNLDFPNIMVQNTSGDNRDIFSILGIDDVVFQPTARASATIVYPTEFQERVRVTGVTPVAGTHEGLLVVLAEPIEKDGLAWGWAHGTCITKVYCNSITQHCYRADLTDGETGYLTTSALGEVEVLWRDSGEGLGECWAIVKLGLRTALDHQLMRGSATRWMDPIRTIHIGPSLTGNVSFPFDGTMLIG